LLELPSQQKEVGPVAWSTFAIGKIFEPQSLGSF